MQINNGKAFIFMQIFMKINYLFEKIFFIPWIFILKHWVNFFFLLKDMQ